MGIRASTETKLLDAADELFLTHGISATPIDAVLARAGGSAATLCRGYASKEALVAAALERRQNAWLEVWDRAIDRQKTARGKLLSALTPSTSSTGVRTEHAGVHSSGPQPSTPARPRK